MNLIINKEFNDVYGILSSFMIISNHNYFRNQMEEKWNLEFDNQIIKDARELLNNDVFHKDKYLVDIEIGTRDIFINPNLIAKSSNLDQYFKYLQLQSEDELRTSIFKSLEFEELINLKKESYLEVTLERIDKMNLDGDVKWYFISLIKNPKSYIAKFINLIKEYLPLYEKLKKSYWKDYQEFVHWIDKKISEYGIDFIDKYLGFINLKQYDVIYLNYSIFDLLSSHDFGDGSIHVFIGTIFKKYVEEEKNKNDVDKHLNIYKVLSDKTRFDIIKILIKNESYGQEIAEQLGITTATVSYHMDFLFGASLVTIQRKSRRLYYSVNKKEIRRSISFLERELFL